MVAIRAAIAPATATIACVPSYFGANDPQYFGANDPQLHWFSDPAVLAPLALLAGIYVWRFREARREAGGRGAGALQAAAFTGAMLALLAAFVSPLDDLG